MAGRRKPDVVTPAIPSTFPPVALWPVVDRSAVASLDAGRRRRFRSSPGRHFAAARVRRPFLVRCLVCTRRGPGASSQPTPCRRGQPLPNGTTRRHVASAMLSCHQEIIPLARGREHTRAAIAMPPPVLRTPLRRARTTHANVQRGPHGPDNKARRHLPSAVTVGGSERPDSAAIGTWPGNGRGAAQRLASDPPDCGWVVGPARDDSNDRRARTCLPAAQRHCATLHSGRD